MRVFCVASASESLAAILGWCDAGLIETYPVLTYGKKIGKGRSRNFMPISGNISSKKERILLEGNAMTRNLRGDT